MVYPDGKAFEVEFVTLDRATLAIVTLPAEAVRVATKGEIARAESRNA